MRAFKLPFETPFRLRVVAHDLPYRDLAGRTRAGCIRCAGCLSAHISIFERIYVHSVLLVDLETTMDQIVSDLSGERLRSNFII